MQANGDLINNGNITAHSSDVVFSVSLCEAPYARADMEDFEEFYGVPPLTLGKISKLSLPIFAA